MAEYNKVLFYRANNETHSVKLYDSADDLEGAIAIQDGDATVYAALGSVSDAAASHLRIHVNSITQAILAEYVTDKIHGPGPQTLIAGTMSEGYFGTLEPYHTDYIEPWKVLNAVWGVGASDKASLESQWGSKGNGNLTFSGGTAYPTATDNLDVPWMKFALDGKVLLIPLRPFAHSISWDQINAKSAVHGKNISIDGVNYKCRLFRGANTDPVTGSGDARFDQSEWNRLMYKVAAISAKGTADWDNFTADDLGLNGQGYCSWCQEVVGTYRVYRGYIGDVSYFYGYYSPGHTYNRCGFRPVLELITE